MVARPFRKAKGTRSEANAGDARGGAVGQYPLSLDGRGLEACPGLEPGVRVKHGWEKGLF